MGKSAKENTVEICEEFVSLRNDFQLKTNTEENKWTVSSYYLEWAKFLINRFCPRLWRFCIDVFVESLQPYSAYRMFLSGEGIRRADNIHHNTVVQTPKVHVTLSQNILTFST